MLDFKEEVLHHAAGQVDPAVAQQSPDDEIAVPPVHLVESPAGDHIVVFEIEQPGRADFAGINLSRSSDQLRQPLDANLTTFLQFLHRSRSRESRRKIEYRSSG